MRLLKFISLAFIFSCFIIETSFASITDGLVGYYPLDNNALDASGFFNDGDIYGAEYILSKNDCERSAYYFDGVDDYIEIPNTIDIATAPNENFSVVVWVKIPEAQNDTDLKQNLIISKADSYKYPFRLALTHSTGIVQASRWDTYNSVSILSNDPLNDNTFHMIVFQKEGKYVSFYVDGILQGERLDPTVNASNSQPILLGTRNNHSSNYFTGAIDDVRFYNRFLTKTEIVELYLLGKNKCQTSPYCGQEELNSHYAAGYSNGFEDGQSHQAPMEIVVEKIVEVPVEKIIYVEVPIYYDNNNGHGNDPGGVDESNPGKSKNK